MRGAGRSGARRRFGRWSHRTGLGLLVLAGFLAVGCAQRLRPTEVAGRLRLEHRTLHYTIDRPALLGEPGWKRVRIEESDFAMRHPDGSALALASSCRPTRATAAQLAFHVLHATGSKRIGSGEPLEHRGLAGFAQDLEHVEGERWLRLRTVTLRGAECSYDWFLLAADAARFDALRPAFDAWWQSFEPAARERPPAPPATATDAPRQGDAAAPGPEVSAP